MKRYLSYIVFVVLSIAVIGCTKTETDSISSEVGQLTLQFSNRALTTRAAGAADDDHNEDLIKSVQLFFYTSNSDSEAAVYALKKDIDVSDFNEGKPNTTLSLIIPAGDMNTLFPDNATSCYIYAVANYATDLTASKPSVKTIKATELDTDFSKEQESFVMDGDLVKISKSGNTLTAEKPIELTRAAAKIELIVDVTNLDIDGKMWEANTADMKVSFFKGVKKGLIDDGSDVQNATVDHNGDYFDVEDRTFSPVGTSTTSTTQFKQSVPFYSYTTRWEANAEDEVYLKLSIPWKVTTADAEAYQTYYYLIPVNMDGKSLVRNSFYKITLDVKALGGQSEPIEVKPSYVVLDWSTGEVNVDLSRPKYLIVDENSVEIYNQNSYSIGYQSSEPVTITVDQIVFESYRYATTRTVTITDSGTTINPSATLTVNDKYADYSAANDTTNSEVDFSHTMLANTFVPHEIYITVKHTNDTTGTFSEQIVIKQYPPIYIKSDKSNGKVFINNYKYGDQYNRNLGYYVALDDNRNTIGTFSDPDGISGNDTGTNVNQNTYNVYITSLPSSETNIIGDPRVENGTTLSNIGGLTKYRQTRTDVTNIIAPAFKIASSYGKTVSMTYEEAVKRCASYQEDGFPMGRWRIPTQAEIEFMQQRALNKDIPSLFNGNKNWGTCTGYWAADGMVYWPGYNSN
ncbi:MAG: hypothetical protein IKJ48_04735, partial [Alistipes sp.]|nr:hypothetical protein [Alistipes sp.]